VLRSKNSLKSYRKKSGLFPRINYFYEGWYVITYPAVESWGFGGISRFLGRLKKDGQTLGVLCRGNQIVKHLRDKSRLQTYD